MPRPTPSGVPVTMTSPGSSVMNRLRWATISATEKIMSLVVLFCRITPLTFSDTGRFCGSGISSAVTR